MRREENETRRVECERLLLDHVFGVAVDARAGDIVIVRCVSCATSPQASVLLLRRIGMSTPGSETFGRAGLIDYLKYGDDGTWSAISIRVGTPAQWSMLWSAPCARRLGCGPYGCDNSELDSSAWRKLLQNCSFSGRQEH